MEIFETIKDFVINQFKLHDNQFGYVDEKLEQINKIDNNSDPMILLNMLHFLNRRFILNCGKISVISYVTENSSDLDELLKKMDKELYLTVKRYRTINKVLKQ